VPGFGYYKFYKIGKTWYEAQATCAKEGAHLIIPNSDEEFEAIKKIWDRYPSPYTDWRKNHVFMGVSDIAREGHFMSVLGKSFLPSFCPFYSPFLSFLLSFFLTSFGRSLRMGDQPI
jgi:hypothetical protein